MTKKHFERIAQALRTSHPQPVCTGPEFARYIKLCTDIADICAADNSSFRRITFLTACGL